MSQWNIIIFPSVAVNRKRWICFFIQWVCYQQRRRHSSGLRACIMEISVQHCTSSPAFSNGLLSLLWKSTIVGCGSRKYLSNRGALLLHYWIFHLAGSVMVKMNCRFTSSMKMCSKIELQMGFLHSSDWCRMIWMICFLTGLHWKHFQWSVQDGLFMDHWIMLVLYSEQWWKEKEARWEQRAVLICYHPLPVPKSARTDELSWISFGLKTPSWTLKDRGSGDSPWECHL